MEEGVHKISLLMLRGWIECLPFVGRVCLDRQSVNFVLHHGTERIVNHTMPRRQRYAVKLCRHQPQLVVSAAALGAFVTDMLARFVEDFDGFWRKRGEALPHAFNGVHRIPVDRPPALEKVLWLFRFFFFNIAGQHQRLSNHEQQHQSHAAKEFKVHPGIGGEIERHVQVEDTHHG